MEIVLFVIIILYSNLFYCCSPSPYSLNENIPVSCLQRTIMLLPSYLIACTAAINKHKMNKKPSILIPEPGLYINPSYGAGTGGYSTLQYIYGGIQYLTVHIQGDTGVGGQVDPLPLYFRSMNVECYIFLESFYAPL